MAKARNFLAATAAGLWHIGMCAGSAHATPDYFTLSPEQLFDATVISATKTSETWRDTPAAVFVLSGENIKRSGATSIPEALRLVPGVQVAQVNSHSYAVTIRGFNSALANKLLVLIDGRETYDHLFSGVYWDAQDTMLEDIERIEVIRGPGGALWGANAVNGVINVITKNAKKTQGGLASLAAGNQERAAANARYGGKIGKDGHYRVYAKYANRNHQETLSGTDARDEWDAYRTGFRADWESGTDGKTFTLQGDAYRNKLGQIRTFPDSSTREDDIRAQGANLLGRYEYAPAPGGKLSVQTYLDYLYRDQTLLKDERLSFDIDAQYEFPEIGVHKAVVGGRYRFSDDRLTKSTFVTFGNSGEHERLTSLFFQDTVTLVPETWFLTLGAKLEYNIYTGAEAQPNVRLQWRPDERSTLWSAVSRAVRTPSRLDRDLVINQRVVGGVPLVVATGDPRFESESLIAYEAGYRRQWTEGLTVDLAAFYHDYSDLSVYTLRSTSPLVFAPANGMTGEAFGAEVTADWQALPVLNFIASYSLMDLQLHNHAAGTFPGTENGERQSPQHQFNLRALWDVAEDVSWDGTLYYVSALEGYGVNEYWRLDTRIAKRLNERTELSLVGQNLFNPPHREFSATKIRSALYGKIAWSF
jgi:iron complex outermembrane receptor protein